MFPLLFRKQKGNKNKVNHRTVRKIQIRKMILKNQFYQPNIFTATFSNIRLHVSLPKAKINLFPCET